MFDCATERYDELYAPYLNKPESLLKLGGYSPKDQLLDLCGGTGAVTKAAEGMCPVQTPTERLARWSRNYLVDNNPRYHGQTADCAMWDANDVGTLFDHVPMFDLVVCRQAMGYLNPATVFREIHSLLKPGGRFVFDTFVQPKRFRVKLRKVDDVPYLEFGAFLFGHIFHIQTRWDYKWGVDFSVFRYHSPEFLRARAIKYFDVKVVSTSQGRGLNWLCVKEGQG